MTKILDLGDFWIEYFDSIPVTTVTDNVSADSAVFNLQKPGHFVGGVAFIHGGIGGRPTTLILAEDSSSLLYGEQATGIRVRLQVETGSPVVVSTAAIVFMRK